MTSVIILNPQICRSLAMDSKMKRVIHGDVGLNICDACCVGRNCNEAECFALKKGNLLNASRVNTHLSIILFFTTLKMKQINIHRYC